MLLASLQQFIPNQAYMNRQPNIRASQPRQNMNIAASPNQNMYSMPNTTTMFINPNQQVYGTHPGQVIVQTATGSQVVSFAYFSYEYFVFYDFLKGYSNS